MEIDDNPESAFVQILNRERRLNHYQQDNMSTRYVVGLDLGQVQDSTAFSVLRSNLSKLEVVHLERLPLGTSYPDVVRRTKSLLATPKLAGKSTLVVDRTGCGMPTCDMIRETGLSCEAVTITSGGKAHQEFSKGKPLHNWLVPKIDLVSCLQVLAQNRKLEIAKGLKDGSTLAKELKSFKAKISNSGHVSYEAADSWREAAHDDLVLGTALAAWWFTKKKATKVSQRQVKILRAMTSFH